MQKYINKNRKSSPHSQLSAAVLCLSSAITPNTMMPVPNILNICNVLVVKISPALLPYSFPSDLVVHFVIPLLLVFIYIYISFLTKTYFIQPASKQD